MRWRIREARERLAQRVVMAIAWRLPRRLVASCYIRVAVTATTGAYANTVVPDLPMMDALQRWDAASRAG